MTDAKRTEGNFFEDFEVGRVIHHAVPRTVSEGDMALYIALYGDRRPLHCAREFAQTLGYQRETVHDMLVFHMVLPVGLDLFFIFFVGTVQAFVFTMLTLTYIAVALK